MRSIQLQQQQHMSFQQQQQQRQQDTGSPARASPLPQADDSFSTSVAGDDFIDIPAVSPAPAGGSSPKSDQSVGAMEPQAPARRLKGDYGFQIMAGTSQGSNMRLARADYGAPRISSLSPEGPGRLSGMVLRGDYLINFDGDSQTLNPSPHLAICGRAERVSVRELHDQTPGSSNLQPGHAAWRPVVKRPGRLGGRHEKLTTVTRYSLRGMND